MTELPSQERTQQVFSPWVISPGEDFWRLHQVTRKLHELEVTPTMSRRVIGRLLHFLLRFQNILGRRDLQVWWRFLSRLWLRLQLAETSSSCALSLHLRWAIFIICADSVIFIIFVSCKFFVWSCPVFRVLRVFQLWVLRLWLWIWLLPWLQT